MQRSVRGGQSCPPTLDRSSAGVRPKLHPHSPRRGIGGPCRSGESGHYTPRSAPHGSYWGPILFPCMLPRATRMVSQCCLSPTPPPCRRIRTAASGRSLLRQVNQLLIGCRAGGGAKFSQNKGSRFHRDRFMSCFLGVSSGDATHQNSAD
jgi:hypothetical protein